MAAFFRVGIEDERAPKEAEAKLFLEAHPMDRTHKDIVDTL